MVQCETLDCELLFIAANSGEVGINSSAGRSLQHGEACRKESLRVVAGWSIDRVAAGRRKLFSG